MNPDLPALPPGYESAGPFIASFEFFTRPVVALACPCLASAISAFLHPSMPFEGFGAPDRRIVVDARGVIVLGHRASMFAADQWVMSNEAREQLVRNGWKVDHDDAMTETAALEALWANS